MTIEQPATLNRFVHSDMPLTWATRRKWLGSIWPILVFNSVVMAEQVAFHAWVNDQSLLTRLPLLLVAALVPFAFVVLALEISLRLKFGAKRVLKGGAKEVYISSAKQPRIRWKHVQRWRLEPVPNEP